MSIVETRLYEGAMFFDQLLAQISIRTGEDGKQLCEIDHETLRQILKAAASSIKFDEEYYLKRYPDIAEALQAGDIISAHEHFIEHGYFENRIPHDIYVDESFYTNQYEDVMQAMRKGTVSSGRSHFEEAGRQEGRLPSANFRYFRSRVDEPRQRPAHRRATPVLTKGRLAMSDRLYGVVSQSPGAR